MKKYIYCMVLMLTLPLMGHLSYAQDNPVGDDEAGWWSAPNPDDDAFPFAHLEIRPDAKVFAYDKEGNLVDKGFIDTQSTGPMQVVMDKVGQFAWQYMRMSPEQYETDEKVFRPMTLSYLEFAEDFEKQKAPPTFEKKTSGADSLSSIEDPADYVFAALGAEAQGKALMDSGAATIQGKECKLFKLGESKSNRFVTLAHYALCPQRNMYKMTSGGDWQTFTPQPLSASASTEEEDLLPDSIRGWWSADPSPNSTFPFVHLELRSYKEVIAYDAAGHVVDTGFMDDPETEMYRQVVLKKLGNFNWRFLRPSLDDPSQFRTVYNDEFEEDFEYQLKAPTFNK